jgi:hypothetical protein
VSELNKTSIENQNLSKVDKSRRRFAKAGAATPIIMTLVSQPAFGWGGGMQCMSNMMSGNLSDPTRGSCDPGWPPSQWCEPFGTVNHMVSIRAWKKAGLRYGKLKDGKNKYQMKSYKGGSYIKNLPSLHLGLDGKTPLREVAIGGHGSHAQACITAYLNASLPNVNYVLSQQQVIDLCRGTTPVPGSGSLAGFLSTTW